MTAKIDWYREVLELEPNSKVFFPLARLLAEDGNREEAVTLLERGLQRHPEFLEARLLRIELLYQDGHNAECNAEIAKLSRMFASYAGFWQAWAACLASEQGQSDTASLIRFLAAHFVSGPLHLHEVLNRGLDALLNDNQKEQKAHTRLEAPQESLETTFETADESQVAGSAPAPLSEAQVLQPLASECMDACKPAGQAEAAEVFMTNTGAMLADLDSELEGSQSVEATIAQPELAAEKNVQLSIAPEVLPGSASHEGMLQEAYDEGNGQLAGQETVLTEMDEIPAVVVSDVLEDAAAPTGQVADEATMSESVEVAEDQSLPEAVSVIPVEETREDSLEFAIPASAQEATGENLESDIALEELPAPTPAAPGLEVDMEAVLTEPEPDLAENRSAHEPAVDAVLSAEEPEEGANHDLAAHETVRITSESEIEPEVAAQLTESEADFFAAPLEQEKPGRPPVTVEEAEADMVEGLDLPEMNLPDMGQTPQESVSIESETAEEPEEPFSLRTRSMAEVLAEQGDIQGALDIYEELAAAATSGDEVEDINRRVATLRGRLSIANASANFNAAEEASAAQNKEKLISMLEALAQRVEARAQ